MKLRVIKQLLKMCRSYISSMRLIKVSINAFISETDLKGKTYDSAKEYSSNTYIPLADGIILLSEAMIEAHQQFPQKYIDEVDSNSLDSDILHDQIQRVENMIQSMKSVREKHGIQVLILFPLVK